ncbi:importin subunit alpha-like isoform X1 [Wolffia australiana]
MSLRPGGGGRRGRGEARRGKYKKGVDLVEARRRREEGFVEIRKDKRGDSLSRKRRLVFSSSEDSVNIQGAESIYQGSLACHRHGVGISAEFSEDEMEKISEMALWLCSEDQAQQIKASTYFRKITSLGVRDPYSLPPSLHLCSYLKCIYQSDGSLLFHSEETGPIDLVIKAGVVPRLVHFISRNDLQAQQFEAARTLVNITSGTSEQTRVTVDDHDAVPNLVQLLSSQNEELREQAVCALGNIAGDSSTCRDIVLANGALIQLISLLNPRSKLSMLRTASWALSNFFRGDPVTIDYQIKSALSVLQKLLYSNDDTILENACWGLAYLFGGTENQLVDIFDGDGVITRLVQLLMHPSPAVKTVSLKTLANISAGDDSQSQVIVDKGVLSCLLQFLKSHDHNSSIRQLTGRIISNIIAGNHSQVQLVIDSKIIPPLISQLKHAEFNVKREAAFVILNATSRGTFEQIHFIANQGCIPSLCNLLGSLDSEVVAVCLEALENMLKVGEAEKELGNEDGAVNVYAQEVDDCDGLAKIEDLQLHPHPAISHAAIRMLERYWEEDEDDNDGVNEAGEEDKRDEGDDGDNSADAQTTVR